MLAGIGPYDRVPGRAGYYRQAHHALGVHALRRLWIEEGKRRGYRLEDA